MAQVGFIGLQKWIQHLVAGLCCTPQRPVVGRWCCLVKGQRQSWGVWSRNYHTHWLVHYIHEESGDRIRIFETNLNKPAVFFEKGGGNWTLVASKRLHKIHLKIWQNGNIRISPLRTPLGASAFSPWKLLSHLAVCWTARCLGAWGGGKLWKEYCLTKNLMTSEEGFWELDGKCGHFEAAAHPPLISRTKRDNGRPTTRPLPLADLLQTVLGPNLCHSLQHKILTSYISTQYTVLKKNTVLSHMAIHIGSPTYNFRSL